MTQGIKDVKKRFVLAAAMTFAMATSVQAAYRDNGGTQWPTLFGADKAECAGKHAVAKESGAPVMTFDSINFAYKSTTVSGSKTELNAAKKAIKRSGGANFVVVGHTDSKGSAAYNQTLSEQRAQAVVNWLVENGVNADQLTAKGAGESKPIASNDTAEGRAQNRRVELHQAN